MSLIVYQTTVYGGFITKRAKCTYVICKMMVIYVTATPQQLPGPSRRMINTLRPRQDGHHFPDDILKCISLNENEWIALTISLKCVRKIRINTIPSLVQIMAWRRPGDKPLSEPMMVSLLTHICVTRPQWTKSGSFIIHWLQSIQRLIICAKKYVFLMCLNKNYSMQTWFKCAMHCI